MLEQLSMASKVDSSCDDFLAETFLHVQQFAEKKMFNSLSNMRDRILSTFEGLSYHLIYLQRAANSQCIQCLL